MSSAASPQDLVIMKNMVSPSPSSSTTPSQTNNTGEQPLNFQVHLHHQHHMIQVRQQQLMHLHMLQQSASSHPRFSQNGQHHNGHFHPYHPSSSTTATAMGAGAGVPGRNSSPVSPMRIGRRRSSFALDEESVFVSPLSIQPRQRHLVRQKLKFTYLSDVPDSMVVQSSCGLHSYRVEQKLRSNHEVMGFDVFVPSSGNNGTEAEEDEEDDPVFCSSSSPPSSSRSLSPDRLEDAPPPTLVDRLSELEQMMGPLGA